MGDVAPALTRGRRRWPWVAGGCVVLVALAAASFWWLFVPHWRPPLRAGERFGVDVSAHQGEIEWERVSADEIEFAYIKATEGGDFIDARFHENWRGAQRAGLDRGAYHFFTLCRDAKVQAHHFLAVAEPVAGALPPAVDLELAGNCRRRPSAGDLESELREFLQLVETAWGQPAILYVGDDWEGRYPTRHDLGRELWHARFLRRPNVDGWRIWQLHGWARVEGISGGVDLDVMRAGPSLDS